MTGRRLSYVSLFVMDLAKSRFFYADLMDLPVVSDEDWGVVLDAGGVHIHLHPAGSERPPQHVEMTFDVPDADAAISDLRAAGVPVIEEPMDREWGARDGAVADPDGNVVYLSSEGRPTVS